MERKLKFVLMLVIISIYLDVSLSSKLPLVLTRGNPGEEDVEIHEEGINYANGPFFLLKSLEKDNSFRNFPEKQIRSPTPSRSDLWSDAWITKLVEKARAPLLKLEKEFNQDALQFDTSKRSLIRGEIYNSPFIPNGSDVSFGPKNKFKDNFPYIFSSGKRNTGNQEEESLSANADIDSGNKTEKDEFVKIHRG